MAHATIRLPAGEFLGRVRFSRDTQDLLFRETVHPEGQVIPRHHHEAPHFCIGLAGCCDERIRNRDVECVPGTVEFHPAGTCHSSRWRAGGGSCFTVTLGAAWMALLEEGDHDIRPRPGVLSPDAGTMMVSLRQAAGNGASDADVAGMMTALVASSSALSIDRFTRAPVWLRRAECYAREHALEEIRVRDVAREAGVHPVLLTRWFQRVHGMTIGTFVRRQRVARARSLLSDSSLTLSDIAHRCGFADHAHFTRSFRRVMGRSPSDFRGLPSPENERRGS
jgi:AraC family transcriptional regulator